jgi:protoheme IX farnesyltransferase
MHKLRLYYSLTKPGVLYGNVLTGVAGFLLASRWHIDWGLFAAAIGGMILVIGSACALNNYLDRDIDSKMERTKKRATVTGAVPGAHAAIFAAILGLAGTAVLAFFTNWLVLIIGLAGFIDYVVFYGMLSKRRSVHGTLVGSISGAAPILGGYCAASGRLNAGAVIVFLILFFWQMPEFYSISIYRRDEYAAAGVPVISVVKGIAHTKLQILVYTAAFTVCIGLLSLVGTTGYSFLVVMMALSLYWLWLAIKGQTAADDSRWARRMFRFSLIIILSLSVMLSFGSVLP